MKSLDNQDNTWSLLMQRLMARNVPRFIAHIKEKGGVSEEEWRWLICTDDNPNYPEALLMRADEYLLYPKDNQLFQKGLFVLVKAIAIMSFCPGGIKFLGLRFSHVIENFVIIEHEI